MYMLNARCMVVPDIWLPETCRLEPDIHQTLNILPCQILGILLPPDISQDLAGY